MIKVVAPPSGCLVADRAIQIHGGAGVSQDTLRSRRLHAGWRTLRLADGARRGPPRHGRQARAEAPADSGGEALEKLLFTFTPPRRDLGSRRRSPTCAWSSRIDRPRPAFMRLATIASPRKRATPPAAVKIASAREEGRRQEEEGRRRQLGVFAAMAAEAQRSGPRAPTSCSFSSCARWPTRSRTRKRLEAAVLAGRCT